MSQSERRKKANKQRQARHKEQRLKNLAEKYSGRSGVPAEVFLQNPDLLQELESTYNPNEQRRLYDTFRGMHQENERMRSMGIDPSAPVAPIDPSIYTRQAPPVAPPPQAPYVPQPEAAPAQAPAVETAPVTPEEVIGQQMAQQQQQQTGYSPMTQQLIEMNNISNPDLIQPGQVLKTPVSYGGAGDEYVVNKGDYLSGIGEKLALQQQAVERAQAGEGSLGERADVLGWGGLIANGLKNAFSGGSGEPNKFQQRQAWREKHGLGR